MKNTIKIIILPLYENNSTYSIFNYNNTNKSHLDIVKADKLLNELSLHFNISQIDILGGEISLLSDFYFTMLYNLLKVYNKKINVFTNFKKINKSIINNCNSINVIYNFNEDNKEVDNNILAANKINKIINIKALDISCLKNQNVIINKLNNLNIKSFEIIPNHFNNFKDYDLFERVVKTFLEKNSLMKFAFQNKLQLDNVLPIDNYNIQTVYIIPEGKYAIQYFNNNFPKLLMIDNILNLKEKLSELEIFSNNYCQNCTSKLICMANYFLNYDYTGISCSGFKRLIKDYKTRNK